MEEWKYLNICNDYMISNQGRLKSLKRGGETIMQPRHTADGYLQYNIFKNGKCITLRAHRVVAEHFLTNPENKPTVNHIDGNKENNNVNNLEWATLNEQMTHAYKNRLKKPVRGYLQGNSKLTEKDVKEIRKCYKRGDKQCGMNALAKKYGVSLSVINKVIGRRTYKNVE